MASANEATSQRVGIGRVFVLGFVGGLGTLFAVLLLAILVFVLVIAGIFSYPAYDGPAVEPVETTGDDDLDADDYEGRPRRMHHRAHRATHTLPDLMHELRFSNDRDPAPAHVWLTSDVETTLNYRMAPKGSSSGVTTAVKRAVRSQLERCLEERCDLEVRYICSVCGDAKAHPDQGDIMERGPLVFDADNKSFIARAFKFTPRARATVPEYVPFGRLPGVTIQLLNNGISFSQVHVCVDVEVPDGCLADQPDNLSAEEVELDSMIEVTPSSAVGTAFAASTSNTLVKEIAVVDQPDAAIPDIDISLQGERGNSTAPLSLNIRIVDQNVARRVADKLTAQGKGDLANKVRSKTIPPYRTNYAGLDELSSDAYYVYLRLSCAYTAKAAFRSRIDEAIGDCVSEGPLRALLRQLDAACTEKHLCEEDPISKKDVASQNWTTVASPAKRSTQTLADLGETYLYEKMFVVPDSRNLMSAILEVGLEQANSAATAPIRIRFESGTVHVPFQLLHKPGSGNGAFFGLVFDIAADKQLGPPPDKVGSGWNAPLNDGRELNPVFGLWTKSVAVTSPNDCSKFPNGSVESFSCNHYSAVGRVVAGDFASEPGAPAVAAQTFLAKLKAEASNTRLIWFYGHGQTRFDWPSPSADGRLLDHFSIDRSGEPKIIFDNGNQLRSAVIYNSLYGARILMKQGPLVVLIACEIGRDVEAAGGTSGIYMPQALSAIGARGVIATEAEIPANTASMFGEKFLQHLAKSGKKDGASLAMLRARQEIFQQEGGNLFPLFFYYSGNHGPYGVF